MKRFLLIVAVGSLTSCSSALERHDSPIHHPVVKRENYINNYPQLSLSAMPREKIFLGDHFTITMDIVNQRLAFPNFDLVLKCSGPVNQVVPHDVAKTEFYPDPNAQNMFHLKTGSQTGRLFPFEQRQVSLRLFSSVSGTIFCTTELKVGGKTFKQEIPLQIMPRPISAIPQVPADIISYLSDKAMASCKKHYPCKPPCMKYPDSPESQECLADKNKELFYVPDCPGPPMKDAEVDSYQACLMKKYGFMPP